MIDVTLQNFEAEVITASKSVPVLVDFWATWCGPCKVIGPLLEKLETQYDGRFKLVKIDSDQEQQLAAAFGIRSIPTCILLMNGQPVDGFMGALPEGKIKDGTCFSQDRRGNWFLNIVVEAADVPTRTPERGVGIDLGLKDLATLSTGEKIEHPRFFREMEAKLGKAQRARKKRQVTNLHAKIANCRMDFLHKASTDIVRRFDYIAAGNVSSSKLAKTKMAKSVYDASWHSFKQMLAYKSVANGAWYEEVNEAFSSQVCSSCGALPDSRPKGIADLGIRHWTCSACGCEHDRDVNAAKNILNKSSARSGHRAPAEGIPALQGGEDVNASSPSVR